MGIPQRLRKLLRFEMLQKLISIRFLRLDEGAWNVSVQFHPIGALEIRLGSKPRTAATTGTTGYARAYRRACDSQPQGRSDSAVSCPALRRCALTARFQRWSAQFPFFLNIYHKDAEVKRDVTHGSRARSEHE